jgi:hypothetical protein
MNYLEISILFLFIGFLILFYVTNLIYNKCMKEKAKDTTKEPFRDDLQKAMDAQRNALARAYHMRAKAQEQAKAAQQQLAAQQKIANQRNAQRAKNKAMQQKWDSTRNNEFGKFNEYVKSLRESGADINKKSYAVKNLTDKFLAPAGGAFSNSTPNQLKTLNDKMKRFYAFNKGRDDTILDITNRMTKVNNILGQATAGETITG